MSQSVLKPFSQQITGLVVSCAVVSFLLLVISLWFINAKDQQIGYLKHNQLPFLTTLQSQQEQLQTIHFKINELITLQTAEELAVKHNKVLTLLTPLKKADVFAAVSAYRFFDDSKVQGNLIRVSQNSLRNFDLKTQAQTQLAQVSKSLAITLNDIASNSRAVSANDTALLYQLEGAFVQLTAAFNALSIHTSIDAFEALSEQVKKSTALYAQLSPTFINQASHFRVDFLALEALLITEQRTLSKWRGFIRLLAPYITELKKQQLISSKGLTQQTNAFKQALTSSVAKGESSGAKAEYLNILVYGVLALLTLLLAGLLLLLKRRISAESQKTLSLCQELYEGKDERLLTTTSQEQQTLLALVSKINTPLHTEADYQQLRGFLKQQARHLLSHRQVISWQFDEYRILQPNYLFKKLLNTDNVMINKRWRSWFDHDAQFDLVDAARKAKHSGKIEFLQVSTLSGVPLSVSMSYQEGYLTGTVANDKSLVNEQEKLVDMSNQQEMSKQSYLLHQQYINDMLVSSLLQNQHVLLDAKLPSLKVQRKLIKLLDINQQIQATEAMKSLSTQQKLVDADIVKQLYCAAFNMMHETHIQQGQFNFRCEENIAKRVKLDCQNFYQLTHSLSKVMLVGQFKAQLDFTVALADKNSGQQTLRFMLKVRTESAIARLPRSLSLLQAHIDSPEAIATSGYTYHLAMLFNLFNVTNIKCDFQEHSYRLHFDVPFGISLNDNVSFDTPDLAAAQIVLLSQDEALFSKLKSALYKANAHLDGLNDVDLFKAKMRAATLKQKPINLVILSDDFALDAYEEINQKIATLPEALQPKLMVMQPFFTHRQHRGFYSQDKSLLALPSFLAEVDSLLSNEKANNQVLPANRFTHSSFQPSCTEILIAIKAPEKQLGLLRVIHSLGIQSTLVCDEDNLTSLWQTGRFTLLLTEFETSPFIELAAGKNIKRAILYCKEQQFAALSAEEETIASHWLVEKTPDLAEDKQWVRLLKPWLNIGGHKAKVSSPSALPTTPNESPLEGLDKDIEGLLPDDLFDFNETFFDDLLHHTLPVYEQDAAFDLNAYAVHHGSPELAVLMLDDYLDELTIHINLLEQYLADEQNTNIVSLLADIRNIASILAAPQLVVYCDTLKRQAEKEQTNPESINLFYQELEAIKLYAEEI